MKRWRHRRRCAKLATRCTRPALRAYLEACSEVDIDHAENTPMIAVDFELTGLHAATNRIISIGWTKIDHGMIQLESSCHLLVTSDQSVGSSAAIHELMDHEVAGGIDINDGLERLFEAAAGRIWVFHHAALDVAFLQRACMDWTGMIPPLVVLDTMQMELDLRKRREIPVQQGDLQLSRLRSNYNLPRYTAHNAMIDAFATAELLLAILARMGGDEASQLGPYLRFF